MVSEKDNNELNEPSPQYSAQNASFRLDRSVFKATDAASASNHTADWKDRSYADRLAAAWFLIRHAYRLDGNIKMDRTVFAKRKR